MAGPGWGPPRLDGFILTERLGSGTYATVYKAYAKVGTGRGRNQGTRTSEGLARCPPDPERAGAGNWEVRDSVRAVWCPRPAMPRSDLGWTRWGLTATFRS